MDSSPKMKVIYIQTFMSLFLLLNTKQDILKNVGNQTIDDSHWLFPHTIEVNGYRRLFS